MFTRSPHHAESRRADGKDGRPGHPGGGRPRPVRGGRDPRVAPHPFRRRPGERTALRRLKTTSGTDDVAIATVSVAPGDRGVPPVRSQGALRSVLPPQNPSTAAADGARHGGPDRRGDRDPGGGVGGVGLAAEPVGRLGGPPRGGPGSVGGRRIIGDRGGTDQRGDRGSRPVGTPSAAPEEPAGHARGPVALPAPGLLRPARQAGGRGTRPTAEGDLPGHELLDLEGVRSTGSSRRATRTAPRRRPPSSAGCSRRTTPVTRSETRAGWASCT